MRLLLAAVLLALLAACGSSSKHTGNAAPTTMPGAVACTPVGDAEHADQLMNVTLSEWKIDATAENVARRVTHFVVENAGTERHNFEVVRGEAGDFPKTPNGAIDETKLPEGAVLGAVDVPVGGHCDLTVRLTPGRYTLACNLAEAMDMDDVHGHFAKGNARRSGRVELGGRACTRRPRVPT